MASLCAAITVSALCLFKRKIGLRLKASSERVSAVTKRKDWEET